MTRAKTCADFNIRALRSLNVYRNFIIQFSVGWATRAVPVVPVVNCNNVAIFQLKKFINYYYKINSVIIVLLIYYT